MKSVIISGFFYLSIYAYHNSALPSNTYYVDPNGNDFNSGTLDSPFQTLQKAADNVAPGDKVIVMDGSYSASGPIVVDIKTGGTPGSPIQFLAEHPMMVQLDGENNRSKYGFLLEPGVSNVVIEGFDISSFEKFGIFLSANNEAINLKKNYIHHIGRLCTDAPLGHAGIYVRKGLSVSIVDNIISNIGRYGPGEAGCVPLTEFYKNHDNGISIDGATKIIVHSNSITNTKAGWSVQLYSENGFLTSEFDARNNSFSSGNPYRQGDIIIDFPGIRKSKFVKNIFYWPMVQSLYFDRSAKLFGVSVVANTTYGTVISKRRPVGVKFRSNKTVKRQ